MTSTIHSRPDIYERSENVKNALMFARTACDIHWTEAQARTVEACHRWLAREYVQSLNGLDRVIAGLRCSTRVRRPFIEETVSRARYTYRQFLGLDMRTMEEIMDRVSSSGVSLQMLRDNHTTANKKLCELLSIYEDGRVTQPARLATVLTVLVSCSEYAMDRRQSTGCISLVDEIMKNGVCTNFNHSKYIISHTLSRLLECGSRKLVYRAFGILDKLTKQ